MMTRGTKRWMTVAWITVAIGSRLLAGPDAARARLEKRDYPAARTEYERLLQGSPDDARLAYNAGVAAFRQNDFDGASRHFESVLGNADLKLQERAYFNLANTRFRQGEAATEAGDKQRMWQESEKDYEAALGLNSSNLDARSNLDAVRQMIAALPQPQKQPDSKDSKPDQDKKDDKDKKKPGDQEKKPGDSGDDSDKGDGKQDPGDKNDPGKQGKPKNDPSKDPGKSGEQKDQSNKDQPGMEKNPRQPKPGKDDESKKGGDKEKGKNEGKGDDGQRGDQGQPRPGQAGADGKGGAGGAEPETPDGQMAVRFAERLLDGEKSKEKALIWRPAGPTRENSDPRGRRKTW